MLNNISIKTCALLVLLVITAFQGCSWYGAPPGEGKVAQKFYSKAEPIIKALEEFRLSNGSYPNKLTELAPEYLSHVDWNEHSYESFGNSYKLFFSYEGPGVNSCVYTPEEAWKCSGLI